MNLSEAMMDREDPLEHALSMDIRPDKTIFLQEKERRELHPYIDEAVDQITRKLK